jgi:hypothetical protein
MRLYKKSQIATRYVVILIILLMAFIFIAILIGQSRGVMTALLDKIFG